MEQKEMNELINRLQRNYNRIYLDILKYSQDIEKWIKDGNRKKGDIRRSLKRLDNKYRELQIADRRLKREWLLESDIIKKIPEGVPKYNLRQIKNKVSYLYGLAGEEKPKQYNIDNIYGKNVDVINDIPNFDERNNDLVQKEDEQDNRMITNTSAFKRFVQKIKNRATDVKKYASRVAAVGFAAIIAIFGGATVGESNSNQKFDTIKTKPYIDTNKVNNEFKESLYFDTSESSKHVEEETKATIEIVSEKSENATMAKSDKLHKKGEQRQEKKVKEASETSVKQRVNSKASVQKKKDKNPLIDEGRGNYLVKEGIKYTSVSDGTGDVGYFSKDRNVKVYNMALVKTHKDGNKEILYSTMPGESWDECIEREGLDKKEIQKNVKSDDVEICYSLQSEDGTQLFGWVNKNKVQKNKENKNEKIEKENNEER